MNETNRNISIHTAVRFTMVEKGIHAAELRKPLDFSMSRNLSVLSMGL